MSYSYDGIEYGPKLNPDSVFELHFKKKIDRVLPSYKDALLRNAHIMRDSYNDPFDVCLSGGTDSEVVVRTFKEAGINHNTFIFRLENDHNIRDVTAAIALCDELNIPYKIIDFNVEKFFETEALDLLNKTYIPMAGRLPRLKFLDYLDNIPIFGDGEPYWRRELGIDYSSKSTWLCSVKEDYYSLSAYASMIGRVVIADWYEYTPEVNLAYKEHPIIKRLFNDEIIGKSSTVTTRVPLHATIWPDMRYKPKYAGYEGASLPQMHRPMFMNKFYETYMSHIEDQKLELTVDEIDKLCFN
jgi:hypothetical protein